MSAFSETDSASTGEAERAPDPQSLNEWLTTKTTRELLGYTRSGFSRFLDEHSEVETVVLGEGDEKGGETLEVATCPILGGNRKPKSSWRFHRDYVLRYRQQLLPDRPPEGFHGSDGYEAGAEGG